MSTGSFQTDSIEISTITAVSFSSRDRFPDEQAKTVYAIAVPMMITFCAFGIFFNMFVLFTIRLLRQSMNPTLKMTYSLAGADVWSLLVISTGLITHSYLPKAVHLPKTTWQDCASYALEALRLGGILTSILHLLALACNHYFAIASPLKYKSWSHNNSHWINICIVSLWIFPPLFYLIVFAVYSKRTFAPLNTTECNPDFLGTLGFRILVFFTIFLPLAVMTFVYVKIAILLKQLETQLLVGRRMTQEGSGIFGNGSPQRRNSFVRRKSSVVMTALLIVATSLLGWLPAILFFVLTCSVCVYPYTALHSFPWLLFSLTISVNALIILKGLLNPFIYAVRVPEIKHALVSFFDKYILTGRRRTCEGRNEMGSKEDPDL